jgi:hypothetical protein
MGPQSLLRLIETASGFAQVHVEKLTLCRA